MWLTSVDVSKDTDVPYALLVLCLHVLALLRDTQRGHQAPSAWLISAAQRRTQRVSDEHRNEHSKKNDHNFNNEKLAIVTITPTLSIAHFRTILSV